MVHQNGGLPKWLKGSVLKTDSGSTAQLEFESLILRHKIDISLIENQTFFVYKRLNDCKKEENS